MPGRSMRVWRLADFGGGLNLSTNTKFVAKNESPDLDNIVFDTAGRIRRRDGSATYKTVPGGATPQALLWWKEGTFIAVDGTANGNVYFVTDSVVTDSTKDAGAGVTANGYSMNGVFYLIGREMTQGAIRVNSSGAGTDITAGQGSAGAGTPPGSQYSSNIHPKSRFGVVLRDRAWVANIIESGVNFYSRVRFSKVGDPETWRYNDFIDLASDDNDQITGLCVVADRLVVFKTNSVYMIAGTDTDTFTEVPLSVRQLGCAYPRSIAKMDNGVVFAGSDGVKFFGGTKFEHLSAKIDPIPGKPIGSAFANQKYYLLTDEGSGVRRIWVFDFKAGAWTRYSGLAMNHLASDLRDGELFHRLYGASSTNGVTYRLETGSDDAGTQIACYWTSGWLDLDFPEIKKRTKRMYIMTPVASGDITVKRYVDWDDSTFSTKTATGPSPKAHGLKMVSAVGSARSVKVRLENVGGAAMAVDQISFSYFPRQLR